VYPEPFAFGTFVDVKMKQFGASRICPAGKLDEVRYNDEEQFSKWATEVFSSIKGTSKVKVYAINY
jgi:hypothetical protein